MWQLRRVEGESMSPTLQQGQTILVSHSRNYSQGDVVVAFVDGREVIKRVKEYKNGQLFLIGDNPDSSTDSRTFGWLVDRRVHVKVIWPRIKKKNLE